MKTVVFIILVVCLATLLAAQANPSGETEGWWALRGKGPTALQIKAKRFGNTGARVRLTGVEIKTAAISLQADEADYNPVSGQLELHGNVRMNLQNESLQR